MHRYQPGTPRALIGVAAVALTAATLVVAVMAPAAMSYGTREIGVLATTSNAEARPAGLNASLAHMPHPTERTRHGSDSTFRGIAVAGSFRPDSPEAKIGSDPHRISGTVEAMSYSCTAWNLSSSCR